MQNDVTGLEPITRPHQYHHHHPSSLSLSSGESSSRTEQEQQEQDQESSHHTNINPNPNNIIIGHSPAATASASASASAPTPATGSAPALAPAAGVLGEEVEVETVNGVLATRPKTNNNNNHHHNNNNNNHETSIAKFWRRQITLVTGQTECRDHFANERTFLGYLRTASTVALLGVAGCQLFLLLDDGAGGDRQDAMNSGSWSGSGGCRAQYAKILAYTCEAVSILITLCGGYRFWRHQNAIQRGKVQVGGWEVNVIGFAGLAITILTLVLVLMDGCG